MKNNLLTCLFGFHNYSNEITKDKDGNDIHLCTICKRSGSYRYEYGLGYWYDYDGKGNMIHSRYGTGEEYWYDYDNKGNRIHWKDNNQHERWLYNGEWVKVKPLNWEYAK